MDVSCKIKGNYAVFFSDSERLDNKDVLKGDTWISLGRGIRRDFVGGLWVGGVVNMNVQVVGGEYIVVEY